MGKRQVNSTVGMHHNGWGATAPYLLWVYDGKAVKCRKESEGNDEGTIDR